MNKCCNEELNTEEVKFWVIENLIDLFEKFKVEKKEGEKYASRVNALLWKPRQKMI